MTSSFHWKHPSVWRVLSAAGVGSVWGTCIHKSLEDRVINTATDTDDGGRKPAVPSAGTRNSPGFLNLNLFLRPATTHMEPTAAPSRYPKILATSTNVSAADNIAAKNSQQQQQQQQPVKEYDFVILGHGIAGKSALETLQKLSPQASIAVIDPFLAWNHKSKKSQHSKQQTPSSNNSNNNNNKVDFYASRCQGFHPLTRQVQVQVQQQHSDDDHATTIIRYQHAILVATGSRGAPPPHYLLDERALGRILELRPTILPHHTDKTTITRPIWNPAQIRHTVLQAARRGDKVAVLGSGWDAIELAVAVSSSSSTKKPAAACLVFGGKGPLSHVLPQYLSASVAKRLTSIKHNIPILHRSLIRYIGSDQVYSKKKTKSHDHKDDAGLQLYTAKSYDFLDASRTAVQWVVVAPEVSGSMGTAALPTNSTPTHLQAAQDGRAWYQTWSHLTTILANNNKTSTTNALSTANVLACYADDGRIAVNAELSAGNGVYAAGSVAKFPNPWTGNADVAGVGAEDGTQAGLVAACNMARDYQQRKQHGLFGGSSGSSGDMDLSRDMAHLKHPVPVWRSDTATGNSNNSLKEAGIYALCVGSCDSERFSTQAFWWTNQSKRLKQWLDDDDSSAPRSPRRRRTARLVTNPASSLRPVYGRGIVFYMDQEAGQIQGVMIWGFPFTDGKDEDTNDKECQQQLNSKLVQHMQEIILTNGGFRNLGQDSELERVNFVHYLMNTSRQLVAKAITPFAASSSTSITPEDLPRPLIRYTEVRPAGVRRVNVLNRRQEAQGHGFLGEDLFARSAAIAEEAPAPLPSFDSLREQNEDFWEFEASLSKRGTSRDEKTAQRRARAKALQDWAIWEWYQRRWEENEDRARPPREEALWLRKGDENRGVSAKDRFNDSLMKAIFPQGR
ncbi:expressed unknown protein [Seminavis robusta]|uniref:FAD/NAD(P)-binding domain-containing protein n=1 Tax=Seminavis robusta TaxID=568900 RepID=A0A9N8EEX2_9STRA|nr:expressed unknown protein [Seminavis robusta]|eukprot:Sro892_g217000.1 n/a (903) ;mRNA; f:34122-36943